MTTPEPTSDLEAQRWISDQMRSIDQFRSIADATEAHRLEHNCDTYASGEGPLLAVTAAIAKPRRILEVGTGLGYSTAWLAFGAPDASIESVEADPLHAALAREQLTAAGFADRVDVHVGLFDVVGTALLGAFDLIFCDAYIPTPGDLTAFERLSSPACVLITSNLFLGRYDPEMPGLAEGALYREKLLASDEWATAFAGFKAISVRR